MGKCLALTSLIFLSLSGFAQHRSNLLAWRQLDSAIHATKNLRDLNTRLLSLRADAIAAHQDFQVARSYYYELRILDMKTEDTLYFRNSALVDSLLMTKGLSPELQTALHLLLARRLSDFTTGGLRFNRQRYERDDIPVNYAKYTNREIDSVSRYHFELAKEAARKIAVTDIEEVLWLSSDPLIFLFKPVIYDIVSAEQVLYATYSKQDLLPYRLRSMQSSWLSQSADAMIQILETMKDSSSTELQGLKVYGEWLSYHRSDKERLYYIETLARKYIAGRVTEEYTKNAKLYESYLTGLASSPFQAVRMHGIYQLALLWNRQGNGYSPIDEFDGRYRHYNLTRNGYYDTAYRYHPARVLALLEKNRSLLDSFSYLKKTLQLVEEQIRHTHVNVSMEEYNLPGEPMLAELNFRNAGKFFYRISRVENERSSGDNKNWLHTPSLQRLPPIIVDSVELPFTDDYNWHSTYLKLQGMEPGSYVLLFSPKSIDSFPGKADRIYFQVSGIAVVSNDRNVFVVNRKTGFPIEGARLQGGYLKNTSDKSKIKEYVTRNYRSDKKGFISVTDPGMTSVKISYGTDTLITGLDIAEKNIVPDDAYDKEEYDDLIEYFEDNATVHVFTDRGIYRPGQTVYYKAVFMTKDKNSGKDIIMSKKNMRASLFNNVYRKWLKESEPALYIKDAFDKEIDTIPVRLNEYGSMSGSFKIPRNAATGEWHIEPDYIDNGGSDGVFHVEEYKRPSYEISIETPKKELQPGDPFEYKVKLRSFSGAILNGVRINYSIERSGHLPQVNAPAGANVYASANETLIDTFAFTDADGELRIPFTDSSLRQQNIKGQDYWNFSYAISAEAIDETGESYEQDASFNITSQSLSIKLRMQKKYNRGSLKQVSITAKDNNAGTVSKDIRVRIYRLINEGAVFGQRELWKADTWLYTREQLQQWFPAVAFTEMEDTARKEMLLEKTINTGKEEKLYFDSALFKAGNYLIEASCEEYGRTIGITKTEFSIFDDGKGELPERAYAFFHLPYNAAAPGETITYYSGSSEGAIYSIYQLSYYSGNKKQVYGVPRAVIQPAGITAMKWKIPAAATGSAVLSQVFVYNNQVYTNQETIYINDKRPEPTIIIEKYRNRLSPGSKETFVVSIKTKDDNTAAELMTTMYDASLDKLEEHQWRLPRVYRSGNIRHDWTIKINARQRNLDFRLNFQRQFSNSTNPRPVWWMDAGGATDEDVMGDWSRSLSGMKRNIIQNENDVAFNLDQLLEGRVAGLSVGASAGLDEVVVVGYSSVKNKAVSSSVSVIVRGVTSLDSYRQPLIILDGVVYEGDLSKIDVSTITAGMVFKGAEAALLYGAKAINGVLVLSTKGDIVFPQLPPDPPVPARKNFTETAFFFPSIYAGKDGYYKFSFTMPETLTEWNWKMMAHTKNAQFVSLVKKINTRLPLMVQPNMPRLLYQGDRIVLQSRISNLDTMNASGKIVCRVEDVVTGEDITSKFTVTSQANFNVDQKATIATPFSLTVPKEQFNPVKIIVTIRTGNFADGEEHILPVLSPKIFVRQSIPFKFSGNDTTISTVKLPADADLYGIGLSIPDKPQAALLNAIPYLANYSFNCAEQLTNKIRANLMAIKIMRNDSAVQHSFARASAKMDTDDKNQEILPDQLSDETMPWLNLSNQRDMQQSALMKLLDTITTINTIAEHLQKLYKLQDTSGGLSWFPGGKNNFYISQYVLGAFGQMKSNQLLLAESLNSVGFRKFTDQLISYCDMNFINEDIFAGTGMKLQYAYARSYWKDIYPLSAALSDTIRKLLDTSWTYSNNYSLGRQALLIITTLSYMDEKSALGQKAKDLLNSIRQLAIEDAVNGIRWKELADSDDLNTNSEETIALLSEAFERGGTNDDVRKGILQWLLMAKSGYHWSTTKATAAVVDMLSKERGSVGGGTQQIAARLGKSSIAVTNDLLSGSSFAFDTIHITTAGIQLSRENPEIVAAGNFSWFYFTATPPTNTPGNATIRKELFRWNGESKNWIKIDDKTSLKIADRIKVVVTIESSQALRYVYMDDKRAAALEPIESSSGYTYGSDFGFYRSVRDAGFQYFADFIPSGRHEIDYELKVAQEGNFFNGPVSLQCMYRPEISTYSTGMRLQMGR